MSIKVKNSGSWTQTVQVPYVKENGVWKKVHIVYAKKDDGSWGEAHRTAIGQYTSDGGTTYTSPGTFSYTVAQGVRYLKFEIVGASGGGGGLVSARYQNGSCSNMNSQTNTSRNGGNGGVSQRINVTMEVEPGDTFSLVVGSKGTGGSGAWGRALNANSGIYNFSWNNANSSTLSSNGGSDGGPSKVQGPRTINFTAAGSSTGTGAALAFNVVGTSCYNSHGDWNGITWNSSINGGYTSTNGSTKTSQHFHQGTDPTGATISDGTNSNAYSLTVGYSGGLGGTTYGGGYSHSPASGTNGVDGFIKMWKYT
tara:strand:- start:60 stop:989 length:930 start_codon:yes stop_codon:yes gene_type:complete